MRPYVQGVREAVKDAREKAKKAIENNAESQDEFTQWLKEHLRRQRERLKT